MTKHPFNAGIVSSTISIHPLIPTHPFFANTREVPLKHFSFSIFPLFIACLSLLTLTGCDNDSPTTKPVLETKPNDSQTLETPVKSTLDEKVSEPETTPPVTSTTDFKQYFGSWRSILIEENGIVTPNSAGAKVVLTETALSMGGSDNKYQIKTDSLPFQIDFSSATASVPYQGILELKDGKLYLCYSTVKDRPRPTEFKTTESDGNLLFILERAVELSDEDSALSPELAEAIERAIANLEANNMEAYITDLVAPDELAAIKASGWDKTLDFVTKQRDKTLATLKALKSIPPKLEQESTRAVFDLSQVSIEGGVSLPKMTFRKVEGKWYLSNR